MVYLKIQTSQEDILKCCLTAIAGSLVFRSQENHAFLAPRGF